VVAPRCGHIFAVLDKVRISSPVSPSWCFIIFFCQAEDGIRDDLVTGVQTCALPISRHPFGRSAARRGPPKRMPSIDRGGARRTRSEERRVGKEWGARVGRRL